jgi:signal transduction histidine kinase
MKTVLLLGLYNILLKIPQVNEELPSKEERLMAILFIVVLMGSIMAIYALVRSKNVLQDKYEDIEKQSHEIEEKNDELEFRNDTLRLINDEKNSMISVVAHELKTPLGNVEGLASLISLESENLSKSQKEYLQLIIETSRKARETVDSMLDVHKIEADFKVMQKSQHNYIDLINDVIDSNMAMAKSRTVEIELVDHVRTKEIETDPDYFKLILSNILSNAIKFSPENEKVIILVTEKDHSIRFDISDLGPGMDESTRKRLFSSVPKVEMGGGEERVAGMGLFISRKLVEKLNGKIRLEHTSEEGTTFSVEFFK